MSNPKLNSIQPLTQLLPLRVLVVTLRFQKAAKPGFFHHASLNAFIRFLLHSPSDFNQYLVTEPLEAGHTSYQTNDLYRFRVVILSGGETLLAELIIALQQLPRSAPHKGKKAPFGPHLELVSLHDGLEVNSQGALSKRTLTGWKDLSSFDGACLKMALQNWQSKRNLSLHFTTPVRLRGSNKSKERCFVRNNEQFTWATVQDRLFDTFIQLVFSRTGVRYARPTPTPAHWHSTLCFWVHFDYVDQTQTVKKVGGLLGKGELELKAPFDEPLLTVLLLGQYIGIGEYRSFGMGQYQLLSTECSPLYPRPSAVNSLLTKATAIEGINEAYFDSRPEYLNDLGDDDQDIQASRDDDTLHQLYDLASQIRTQKYSIPSLQPIEIDKPDGGARLLNVPPWRDRVLQKAVARHLSQSLDQLYSDHSYGYRRGHSRLNARDAINLAVRQGYHWVLESDVDSFFDSVQWANLSTRLRLLLPNEPLVSCLMSWVTADTLTEENNARARHQGLPQGAPISPMLANLLLDDLDRDMAALDYRIIRYADDFVLLFKTQQAAHAALPKVQKSLAEHGLSINPEKTRIASTQEGFRYLGYLFVDGYAIEVSRADEQEQPTPKRQSITSAPSQAPAMGEREDRGMLLTVTGAIATLYSRQRRLQVEQLDSTQSYPWQSLHSILLIGPHQITTPALRHAMSHNVAIHFASAFGHYQGVASGSAPSPLGADFHLLQRRFLTNSQQSLQVAQSLVSARLHHCRNLIKKRSPHWSGLNKMSRFEAAILRCDNIHSLRGYEGQTAKLLWQFFHEHLDPTWQFNGRNRRPPKDPVNVMLSLGYTQLYAITDSMIRTLGLDPWQAAYHQNHGAHKVLASDLMEPFRHIIERSVLTLINRRQIKPDDFAATNKGCQMSSEARKTLLSDVMARLSQHKPNQQSLLDSIQKQIWAFALACRQQQHFDAWKGKDEDKC